MNEINSRFKLGTIHGHMQGDDLNKEGKVSKETNVLIPRGSRVSKHLHKGSIIITVIVHKRKMRLREMK